MSTPDCGSEQCRAAMAAAASGACGGRLLTRCDGGYLGSICADSPAKSTAGNGGIGKTGTNEVATAFGDNISIDGSGIVAHSPG